MGGDWGRSGLGVWEERIGEGGIKWWSETALQGGPVVAVLPRGGEGGRRPCSAAQCLPGLGLPPTGTTQAQQQPRLCPVGCKQ